MENFKNVELVAKANVYFDGNVTSRSFITSSNERKTLGVMLKGEYVFSTNEAEIMEILSGSAKVKIANETSFKEYKEGDSFNVPANSSFIINVETICDYCCSFLK